MAAHDDNPSYPTNTIVSKKARKHYRAPVRSQHWQLRSLISAEKRHLVYFPGGNGSNHVQRLNTITHECETIKLLTFAPRCLVAENGWLCCGSETGEFVAIRLDEGSDDSQGPGMNLELGPDARRHLGLDGSRQDPLLSLLAQARRTNKSLIAKSMKLAKDRVNCITLWFPPTVFPAFEEAYAEPVAVLANNDRTVVLVSLRDFEQNDKSDPLDVITYPDFVNRAIISPDGRYLVAILDDPYLYVHERMERPAESPSSTSGDAGSGRQWELKQRFLLKSQRKNDRSDSRGSFAACFSPSGAYLAVGTQHGTISIFDTTQLSESGAEPLITTFKSSRPESGPGAIRDMAFCPGPFDILAWTEDRGHIGFADMRSNFVVRQIVDINAEAEFEHIDIFDRNTIDPRLLNNNGERRSTRSPPSAASRRRHGEGLETLNQPLSANETLVLEAIQSDRRRRERLSQRGTGTEEGSRGSDSTWTYLANLRPSANDGDSQRPRERSSSVGRAMGDMLGPYRDQRERASDRMRTARQLAREAGEQRQSLRRLDQRMMDRIGETVAAMRDQRERPDSSYLNVLEILQARERSPGDAEHEDSSLLVPLVNQAMNRWEESAIRGTLAADHGVFEVPPSPDNTAGLAWTADGRTLFVGAQNGIYELHINVQSRKFCPSITMS
ncbi:WD domain-containing protein [Hirsutella rhossiliensis]|uniref:WD domain-containing protein n=1 Tax=Hirsutella rhossiliensis TaxID=111463 RepID=A0A9P8N2J9_9HYPO|nr:WD domain-containing protein [Hirsutella rhossiliensis]KAH0965679.1 WD domain-containing protein [Hirsutella rhossiliensis]